MMFYMIIIGILVSIALLVVIIRFALSPQTDKLVKRAALIALGAICLAIVACLVMILTGPKAVEEEEVFAGLPLAEPVEVANPAKAYMLVVGIIMLLFVGLVIFLSLREEKKNRLRRVKRPG
jgi:hypothetical protein